MLFANPVKYILVFLCILDARAYAQNCTQSPPAKLEFPEGKATPPMLALAGSGKIMLNLESTLAVIAQSGDSLLVKFTDGAILGSRLLTDAEVRAKPSSTKLSDLVRMTFQEIPMVEADAQAVAGFRKAIDMHCEKWLSIKVGEISVFAYQSKNSARNDQHNFFIIDGERVHYLDISGSSALANQLITSLHQRK